MSAPRLTGLLALALTLALAPAALADPSASITANPAKVSTSRSANFSYNISNDNPQQPFTSLSFNCTVDNSAKGCGSSSDGTQTSFSTSYSNLADGDHTFSVTVDWVRQNGETRGTTPAVSFSWQIDATAPTVTAHAPQCGATNAAADSLVTATFSEPMDASSITSSRVTLQQNGQAVPASVSYDAKGRRAVLTPSSKLPLGTTFTARVLGGSNGVRDTAGNALAADSTCSFTTAPVPVPPTVTGVAPADGATQVTTSTSVSADFDKALDASTVDASRFTVTGPGGAVTGSVGYDAANRRATFQPTLPLAAGAQYTARVAGGAGGVKDSEGNALAADRTWSFTTAAPARSADPPPVSAASAAGPAPQAGPVDRCPRLAGGDSADRDGDGAGDRCDVCPDVADADQQDTDGDGTGDVCDRAETPQAGRTVDVRLVSGEVYVQVGELRRAAAATDGPAVSGAPPGFVPLKGVATVPVGSTIDARSGTLEVTTATAASAGPGAATARLAAAVFKIRQRRAEVRRRGGIPSDIVLRTPTGAAAKAGCRSGRRAGKGVVRTMSGATQGGYFRTIGAASTTTVRRGRWATRDRCDGTLTEVGSGVATVVPRAGGKPVRVKAGQGYFVPGNFLRLESPKGRPRSGPS
jgi:hypothetical protein